MLPRSPQCSAEFVPLAKNPCFKSRPGGMDTTGSFHLSTTMPSDQIIDTLIGIQATSVKPIYLLCPFYIAPSSDVQLGMTETAETTDPNTRHTAKRGCEEEFQCIIPEGMIVPKPTLNFGRCETFFADVRSAGTLSRFQRTGPPPRPSPDKSRPKAFVVVFGTLENFSETMSSFVPDESDQITNLMLIPLAQLNAIRTYHEANPKGHDFYRYPRVQNHGSHGVSGYAKR